MKYLVILALFSLNSCNGYVHEFRADYTDESGNRVGAGYKDYKFSGKEVVPTK
jgi:hypothetical protein